MRTSSVLLVFALLVSGPSQLAKATAKNARPPSTSPACALTCPEGFRTAIYTWELHPERTIYDEQGKVLVPPDGLWKVSCGVRCEKHEANDVVKVETVNKVLCESGGEPSPYRGPWRITGQFIRECAALTNNGCGMQCYQVRIVKPSRKKGSGKSPAK